MSLSADQLKEFQSLDYRNLASRYKKHGYKQPAPVIIDPTPSSPAAVAAEVKAEAKDDKAEAKAMQNVVNAIKAMPKPDAPVVNVEVKPAEAKRWTFKHKYDEYGKLVETTATAS